MKSGIKDTMQKVFGHAEPSQIMTANNANQKRHQLPIKHSATCEFTPLEHNAASKFTPNKPKYSPSMDAISDKTPYDLLLEQIQQHREPSSTGHAVASGIPAFESNMGFGRYALHEILGKGSFSKVQLATHQLTKEKVAVKIIDKTKIDAASRRLIFREMTVLDKLHHPNIIRMYEVIESLTRLNIVMEYAAGGDMETRIQRKGAFTDPEGKIIFAQLVSAIRHLHEQNIVHRDIKAENVFFAVRSPIVDPDVKETNNHFGLAAPTATTTVGSLSNSHRSAVVTGRRRYHGARRNSPSEQSVLSPKSGLTHSPDCYRVKIGDFGFSKTIDNPDQQLTTFCGSPPYAAPELFSSKSYLGPPVDMWALGVLLFYMLVGFLPFRGRTVGQLRKVILEVAGGNAPLHVPPRVSEAAASLIRQLLSRNPRHRPRAARLMEEAKRSRPRTLSPSSVGRRLVAAAASAASNMGSSSSFGHRSTESWLANQVFPVPYPAINRKAANGVQGVNQLLTDFTSIPDLKKDASKLPESSSSPTVPQISITLADSNPESPQKSLPGSPRITPSEEVIFQSEIEAAKLLMQLGVSSDRLSAPRNGDARNSITGAYRIMLHQLQRYRRLSNLPSNTDTTIYDDEDGDEGPKETAKSSESRGLSPKKVSRMRKSASDSPLPYQNFRATDKSCAIL